MATTEQQRRWRARHPEYKQATEVSRRAQQNRRHRIKSAFAIWKLEAGCADCGYNADPVALQFDHVRGVKVFELWDAFHHAIERSIEEAEKCDVVCANCHAVRTRDRMS